MAELQRLRAAGLPEPSDAGMMATTAGEGEADPKRQKLSTPFN